VNTANNCSVIYSKEKAFVAKRKTTKGRKPTGGSPSLYDTWSEFNRLRKDPEFKERIRKVSSLLLVLFSILTLLACISYFYTGNIDQSVIEPGVQNPANARNWLGFVGASLSELLIRRGFGIFALIIPLYTAGVGIAWLEDNFYSYIKAAFKYVLFVVLWGSVFLSYFVLLTETDNPDLGGGFGNYINLWFFAYIGKLGMAFVILFAVLIFVVLNFNMEVRASRLVESLSRVGSKSKGEKKKQGPISSFIGLINGFLFGLFKQDEEEEDTTEPKKRTTRKKKTETTAKSGEESSKDSTNKESPENVVNLNLDPPTKKEKASDKEKKEGEVEFVIRESVEEKVVNAKPNPVQLKIPLEKKEGEDNIHEVGDNKFEKVIPKEDQKIDLEDVGDWEDYDPLKDLSRYRYPPLEILKTYESGRNREVNKEELAMNKNKIVKTLNDYGIGIQSIWATIGPTVTLYEIVPAPGVRISKIRNLEDDIALSLAALGIRIIAPMPGKGTIGIEIPNSRRETVSLKGVISTEKFQNAEAELPIALGRTISNEVYVGDLNKMPHLLIAGATGQGKSVGINTMISSLLFKKHPAQVKFVMIDPKKVELNLYQALTYHFMAQLPDQEEPVITETTDAIRVLNSLCMEMDMRYDFLKKAKVRNLREYNNKFISRKLNPRKGHRYLPYIVLIIDELADMMMIAGKEVELPIARLAQLARAVGIHLIVATQRPSVNVITGIIKANFPARISYRVISKVDSRTILDSNGADQLIGRGDMLMYTGQEIIRLQNAFIDTPEVEELVEFISQQQGFPEPYFLPELPSDKDDKDDKEDFEKDDLFEEAARLVVKHQQGSASLIQRKLKLGYNRAGRIIDQLERAGIVGPHSGSKAREVLVYTDSELEQYLRDL